MRRAGQGLPVASASILTFEPHPMGNDHLIGSDKHRLGSSPHPGLANILV